MSRQELSWVPKEVDLDLPSSARVYDYLLGGGHNFEHDRVMAESLAAVVPIRIMAQLNRSFLRRAVLALCDQGIDQFLDLGSGIPTVGNVHEVVQQVNPDARVAYVDIDPVAVAHAELILAGDPRSIVLHADLRAPHTILDRPELRELLDFTRPVGLLMLGVLQYVSDEADPWEVIATYRKALSAGSFLAVSHFTPDGMPEEMAKLEAIFAKTAEPATTRSHTQIERMFAGFELLDPGLVYTVQWRPESPDDVGDHPERSNLLAGVGRKT
ncbi:hypothetical protein D5S17_31375 [Pseudonocardiaceae bacterium YIM PH 21723]|nr:hypothetical protein D5S17_31375 [Pseudonocardiaceae bacterium YIM PH 21723]